MKKIIFFTLFLSTIVLAQVVVSPNMSLPVPIVGTTVGPDWANDINSSLNIIDQHDHSPGSGVRITPNGLNINSDLSIGSNNLILVHSEIFNNLLSPLAGSSPYLGALYVSGGELYYNDVSGNQVKITSSGSVNATSSGIVSGTASAAFSAGVLVVKSTSTSGANVLGQSFVFTNAGNLTNQLTLSAPTLGSSYGLTLPSIPGVASILSIDTSGTIGTSITATMANGIGTSMTSAAASNNIAQNATRSTGTTVGLQGVAISSATGGNFTTSSASYVTIPGLSSTLTTSGRPIRVGLEGGADGNFSYLEFMQSGTITVSIAVLRNGTIVQQWGFGSNQFIEIPLSFSFIDPIGAGTYTYTVQVLIDAPGVLTIFHPFLTAYEL